MEDSYSSYASSSFIHQRYCDVGSIGKSNYSSCVASSTLVPFRDCDVGRSVVRDGREESRSSTINAVTARDHVLVYGVPNL